MAMAYICRRCERLYPSLVGFCWACEADNTIVPVSRRRRAAIDHEPEVATARQLAASSWTLVEVPACPGLRLLKGAFVLLYGPPGAGKSTLGLQMLGSLSGPVVAVMAEERLGPAVGERIARINSLRLREDVIVLGRCTVDDMVSQVRSSGATSMLVDSVSATTLTPEDVEHFIQRLGLRALIGVMQVTKDGKMSGVNAWRHAADAVLHVQPGGRWELVKTRFQDLAPPVTGEIF